MTEAKKFMALCSKNELPCRDEDVREMFFVNPGQEDSEDVEIAKDLCRQCPIFWECRAEGFRIMDKHAILGAYTPADRAQAMETGVAA